MPSVIAYSRFAERRFARSVPRSIFRLPTLISVTTQSSPTEGVPRIIFKPCSIVHDPEKGVTRSVRPALQA